MNFEFREDILGEGLVVEIFETNFLFYGRQLEGDSQTFKTLNFS
jgi:hypothetical protein